jgi:hypothetical protein
MVLLYILAVVIQIVVAVVCYRMAEAKGRSGVLYGILGLVLPVVGLIVTFVVPRRA